MAGWLAGWPEGSWPDLLKGSRCLEAMMPEGHDRHVVMCFAGLGDPRSFYLETLGESWLGLWAPVAGSCGPYKE